MLYDARTEQQWVFWRLKFNFVWTTPQPIFLHKSFSLSCVLRVSGFFWRGGENSICLMPFLCWLVRPLCSLGGWKQCNFHHCGCIFTGERESAGGRNVKLLWKLTIYRCAKLWKPRTYMLRCAAYKTVINFALSKHKQIRILAVLRAIRNIRLRALISFALNLFDVRWASGVF